MVKIINKYYEPELKQVRVVLLEEELNKLEQENERLNNLINENASTKALVVETSKIQKAIEYIKQHKLDYKPNTTTRLEAFTMQERDLLNILQGSDNE